MIIKIILKLPNISSYWVPKLAVFFDDLQPKGKSTLHFIVQSVFQFGIARNLKMAERQLFSHGKPFMAIGRRVSAKLEKFKQQNFT